MGVEPDALSRHPEQVVFMLKFTGALAHADFRPYWLARFLGSFSAQIMGGSVGWQIYHITRDPLDLGLVGLNLFLPAVLLVLVTGTVADRFNRVVVTTICLVGEGVCALSLLAFTVFSGGRVGPIFLTLLALGIVRAFFSPAQQALIINLVPREDPLQEPATWRVLKPRTCAAATIVIRSSTTFDKTSIRCRSRSLIAINPIRNLPRHSKRGESDILTLQKQDTSTLRLHNQKIA